MPFFSPLPGQPKNMAIINSAILYVSARDLRLLNCRINNMCNAALSAATSAPCRAANTKPVRAQ
jgi:hypothetical protein